MNQKTEKKVFPYSSIRPATFESLEEKNRIYSLSLSPIERLSYLMELNINAFGKKSLLMKDFGKKINIR